jgi:hypothetical protein
MLQELQKAPPGINFFESGNIHSTPGLPPGVFFCRHLLQLTGDLQNGNQGNCFLQKDLVFSL